MPRPQKSRRICCYPDYWSFAPDQDTANDTVVMSLDEFETIRLIDYQSKTQEQCAQEMKKTCSGFGRGQTHHHFRRKLYS